MPIARKCIITGRNRLTGIFYMLNKNTNTMETIWWTSGKEPKVRKETERKIFESGSEAKTFLKYLRHEPSVLDIRWFLEYI